MKILADAPRYTKSGSAAGLLKCFLFHPGFRFMVLYRICNHLPAFNPLGFVARVWYKNLKRRYGFQFPHKTKIGKGLFLVHFGGIVINQSAVIGDNCTVSQGVTIGYVNRGNKKGCPVIGDKVWIGANAVVVGNIKVGNNVLIAPLSFVTTDVPDNAVIAGNPAVIINYKGTDEYNNNLVP